MVVVHSDATPHRVLITYSVYNCAYTLLTYEIKMFADSLLYFQQIYRCFTRKNYLNEFYQPVASFIEPAYDVVAGNNLSKAQNFVKLR